MPALNQIPIIRALLCQRRFRVVSGPSSSAGECLLSDRSSHPDLSTWASTGCQSSRLHRLSLFPLATPSANGEDGSALSGKRNQAGRSPADCGGSAFISGTFFQCCGGLLSRCESPQHDQDVPFVERLRNAGANFHARTTTPEFSTTTVTQCSDRRGVGASPSVTLLATCAARWPCQDLGSLLIRSVAGRERVKGIAQLYRILEASL